MHHAPLAGGAHHDAVCEFAAHGAEFCRRVAVAGEFLPRLLAREAGRPVGLGGFVLRQSDVSRAQHGKILADGDVQGEAEHGEAFGQFLGRPVEINVLFEPVKSDFHGNGKLL